MESFRAAYLQKCSELSIEPHRALTELLIKNRSHTSHASLRTAGILDLHGQSLSLKECAALAAALSNDVVFTKVNLADTFLGDEGCILIAGAVKTNCTIRHCDMRGNSIRTDGATAVAQMLKVNTTLRCLVLEWNCIGIWEAGIQILADALSINQTLEELDLRNNKIGPQGAQSLALCLRNNTALRRLDLRWNNIGLLGCRAFLDLLKWNTTLEEIQLAGNEIPEDLARAIYTALERNRERHRNDMRIRAQADSMSSTVDAINSTHQNTVNGLSKDLAAKEQQLLMASKEIAKSHEAYKLLQAKLERVEREKKEFEETRSLERNRVNELQRELVIERDERIRLENQREKIVAEEKRKQLELEISLREAEVALEVMRRDKVLLQDELDRAKERVKNLKIAHEEQIARLENGFDEKMRALESSHEVQLAEKMKKMEDRLRKAEATQTRVENELDSQRAKLVEEKRQWALKISEMEASIRREEEERRRGLEDNISAITRQRDSLQSDLAVQEQTHARAVRQYDSERERWQQQRASLQDNIAQLKASLAEVDTFRPRLEETIKDLRKAEGKIASLTSELSLSKEELARMRSDLISRDNLIGRLKQDIKAKDQELQEKDEENILQMKELQLGINTLVSQRTKRHIRSRSTDVTLT